MPITNQEELRAAFWRAAPKLAQEVQGREPIPRKYRADVCLAFCTFIDQCEQAGVISPELAESATL